MAPLMLCTLALPTDPHLEKGTMFTLLTTPHPTEILTQTLDTATAHHLGIVLGTPSANHSWQEACISHLMKLKCFIKCIITENDKTSRVSKIVLQNNHLPSLKTLR